jgi:hypothetical protein
LAPHLGLRIASASGARLSIRLDPAAITMWQDRPRLTFNPGGTYRVGGAPQRSAGLCL